MSRSIQISDELYDRVATYAAEHGRTVDDFVSVCLAAGVDHLISHSTGYVYNAAEDPLAEFIGAFDSADQPPLQPHEHDLYFAGEACIDDAKK